MTRKVFSFNRNAFSVSHIAILAEILALSLLSALVSTTSYIFAYDRTCVFSIIFFKKYQVV